MKINLKSIMITSILMLFTLTLSACNTMEGIGKDMQAGGKELQKAAANNKQ